jgi:hypothetical protein
MKLYHGTSLRHLKSISDNGLVPRGARPSNWKAASDDKSVYLSDAYALYFADQAQLDDEGLLLVEVETDLLDPTSLRADEDAALHAYQAGALPELHPLLKGYSTPHSRAKAISRELSSLAQDYGIGHLQSLRYLGTCSHLGTIPPDAITRMFAFNGAGKWFLPFHDPIISPENYAICGDEYRAVHLVLAGQLDDALAIEMKIPSLLDLRQLAKYCERFRLDIIQADAA